MKLTGKLDYLELPATGGTLDRLKAFYSAAFSWSFTDYGPTYSAFAEGLDGGFQADAAEAPAKPLPVLYSWDLEATLDAVESAGGHDRQADLFIPRRPALPLCRSGRKRDGGVV
jgi:predicted enzyme related to lactoylglutathione lyase